jgi:hypothetical protein
MAATGRTTIAPSPRSTREKKVTKRVRIAESEYRLTNLRETNDILAGLKCEGATAAWHHADRGAIKINGIDAVGINLSIQHKIVHIIAVLRKYLKSARRYFDGD